MKVVKWGEWDDHFDNEYWKNHGHMCAYTKEEYEAVIKSVQSLGYKFSGEYHQNGDYGVPYFDNGKPFMVTQRNWGYIMAQAWPNEIKAWKNRLPSRKENNDNDYVAFSWFSDEMKNIYVYPSKGEV